MFSHPRLGSAVRSTSAAVLPDAIAAVVDVVTPTTRFPAPLLPIRGNRRAGLLGTNPTAIRAAYNMGDIQANNSGKVREAVSVPLSRRWLEVLP